MTDVPNEQALDQVLLTPDYISVDATEGSRVLAALADIGLRTVGQLWRALRSPDLKERIESIAHLSCAYIMRRVWDHHQTILSLPTDIKQRYAIRD